MAIVVAVVLGIPALYGLYTLFVVLRLLVEARRLRRECAARHFEIETSLFVLLPTDFEDPVVLKVVLRRDRRQLSFSVFQSILSYTFTSVDVEPVALASELRGHVYLQPNDNLSHGIASHYLREGKAQLLTFGIDAMDARYRLSEKIDGANTPEGIALLRSTFASAEVQKLLDAYGGAVEIEYRRLTVHPAARGAPFFDGLERVAQLAEALDSAAKGAGPYR